MTVWRHSHVRTSVCNALHLFVFYVLLCHTAAKACWHLPSAAEDAEELDDIPEVLASIVRCLTC